MWTKTILPNELQSFDYYKQKVPMFLRQSDAFMTHFRIWFDLLLGGDTEYSGILHTADCLLYLLNIFDPDYLSTISSLEGYEGDPPRDAVTSMYLIDSVTDKVYSLSMNNGRLFIEESATYNTAIDDVQLIDNVTDKVYRLFMNNGDLNIEELVASSQPTVRGIQFIDNVTSNVYRLFMNNDDLVIEKVALGGVSDILDKLAKLFGVSRIFSVKYLNDSTIVKEELRLDNRDLLILIKAQIVKNYCDGSTVQIEDFYNAVGLKVYVITSSVNATAELYLAEPQGSDNYSSNVKKMFKAGLLRINSLGVQYADDIVDLANVLEWDATVTSSQGWGRGSWL